MVLRKFLVLAILLIWIEPAWPQDLNDVFDRATANAPAVKTPTVQTDSSNNLNGPAANGGGNDGGGGAVGGGNGLAPGVSAIITEVERERKEAIEKPKYDQKTEKGQEQNAQAENKAKQMLANFGMMQQDAGVVGAPPEGTYGAPTRVSGLVTPRMAPALLKMGEKEPTLARGGAIEQAMAKMNFGDYSAAKQILGQHLIVHDSDPFAFRLRAFVLRQMKNPLGSLKDAGKALALAPKDAWAKSIFMDDLTDLGKAREALGVADGSLDDARVVAARARAWEALGKNEFALKDYRRAAELDSRFDGIYLAAQDRLSPRQKAPGAPRPGLLLLTALGTALLMTSFAVIKHAGVKHAAQLAIRATQYAAPGLKAAGQELPIGFAIVRTLGQGGMGVVYEATDLALQRTVAIKKLRDEVAVNPRERARFLKEARTVAALRHPNIVEIYSVHEDQNGLFLVFEKVNGQTLYERLARGPLDPADAVGVLRQVAMALDYAHSKGVVHQDLKPGNVMVDAASTAKVMDFGIARRVQETLSTLSKREIAGTPAYMAPEQESGHLARPAADIYALGACAYEVLCGCPPFSSNGGVMMKAQKRFRPPSALVPKMSAEVDATIARALEPEPAKRWPSASTFVSALTRALAAARA